MTRSTIDRVQQLSDWLCATDIARLELRGPGETVCLQREGSRIVAVHDEPALDHAAAPGMSATASSVGVFLHRHPLHPLDHTALAEPGDTVRCGQTVGLLQIGALLLPVTSPCDGVVVGTLVEHGTTVGYGERLMALQPLPTDS